MSISYNTPNKKALRLHLDPKSSFFKSRLNSLTEVGYEVEKRLKHVLTLKLKQQ